MNQPYRISSYHRAVTLPLAAAALIIAGGLIASPAARAEVAGEVTLFDSEQSQGEPGPEWMAAGVKGDIWYTAGGAVRRMSSLGRISVASSSLNALMGSGVLLPISASPDGGLWARAMIGSGGPFNSIGRITADGNASLFQPALPTGITPAEEMVSGDDSALWFTTKTNQGSPESLARIATNGDITIFPQVTGSGGSSGSKNGGSNPALRIALGPDGNIWFTKRESTGGRGGVGKITPSGELTDLSSQIPAGFWPGEITAGPDGAIWLGCATSNPQGQKTTDPQVGRMTASGEISLFPVESCPVDMAPGPDGNVWYVAAFKAGEMTARIGRITPSGGVTEFAMDRTRILADGSQMSNMPTAIVPGPQGAMWFNFPATSQLARIATGVNSSTQSQVASVPRKVTRAQVKKGLRLPTRCPERCAVKALMVADDKVVASKTVTLSQAGTKTVRLKAKLKTRTKSLSFRFQSDRWSKIGVAQISR